MLQGVLWEKFWVIYLQKGGLCLSFQLGAQKLRSHHITHWGSPWHNTDRSEDSLHWPQCRPSTSTALSSMPILNKYFSNAGCINLASVPLKDNPIFFKSELACMTTGWSEKIFSQGKLFWLSKVLSFYSEFSLLFLCIPAKGATLPSLLIYIHLLIYIFPITVSWDPQNISGI